MRTQADRAEEFVALHKRDGCFVIPNPWDIGSAQILAGLGFEALATTSRGFAYSIGVDDYEVTRDTKLAHIRSLTAAVDLPISADLENGFGDSPETVAETIKLGALAGLCGGSIEDSKRDGDEPVYDIGLAKERIAAAAEAVRGLPFPFVLTARAENYLVGRPDLADTIARLQAYQEAGADVLFAPFPPTLEDIRTIVRSIDRPLNVVLGPSQGRVSLDELARAGVKRVSVGGAFASTAYAALIEAAVAIRDQGSFELARKRPALSISELLKQGSKS